ncbi:MAG: aspartate kinase [Acidobacteria bacterium]|nr:aspartate kinase [Acidobacteriota bacterium]
MRVLKFGGTSVADAGAVRRLLAIVAREREAAREGPLVVVSALAGVTDRLLAVAGRAGAGDEAGACALVDDLRARHLALLDLVPDGPAREALAAIVDSEVAVLEGLVRALAVLREVSPRTHDTVAAVGELLSSRLVAAALEADGQPAAWVDAREVLVTADEHTQAPPDMEATGAKIDARLRPLLADGRVPVIGGFVGATAEGATTTLGRGGSDYSASIFGALLGATEIQIWTDVDGMLTADPRLVPAARLVSALSFEEASELAYFGAKVLHPSTILPAVGRRIPVRILNSHRPDVAGTLITAGADLREGPIAVACKREVTRIDISSTRMLMAYGFLRRVFEVFERLRTPVDVVTTSEVSVSVTVDDARRLRAIAEALSGFAEVRVAEHRAIVCAVGDAFGRDAALSAQVIGALEGLPLEMISQGGARRNVTVVVPDDQAPAAMRRLHLRFFESSPAVANGGT